MPETICTTVYQFPELSEAAKERARIWYREAAVNDPGCLATWAENRDRFLGRTPVPAAPHQNGGQ